MIVSREKERCFSPHGLMYSIIYGTINSHQLDDDDKIVSWVYRLITIDLVIGSLVFPVFCSIVVDNDHNDVLLVTDSLFNTILFQFLFFLFNLIIYS